MRKYETREELDAALRSMTNRADLIVSIGHECRDGQNVPRTEELCRQLEPMNDAEVVLFWNATMRKTKDLGDGSLAWVKWLHQRYSHQMLSFFQMRTLTLSVERVSLQDADEL